MRTMFTRHRIMFESGELETEFSKLYFFLPSITDIYVEINKHMKCVNIHPFDPDEIEFGDSIQPNLLDFGGGKKKKITDSGFGVLKKNL